MLIASSYLLLPLLFAQAFSIKWYDRAIDFLRVAFKLLERMPEPERPSPAEVAHMHKMRRNLFQLNNHQLYTTKSAITKHAKTHM